MARSYVIQTMDPVELAHTVTLFMVTHTFTLCMATGTISPQVSETE